MLTRHLLSLTLITALGCTIAPEPAPGPAPSPSPTTTGGSSVNYSGVESEIMHRVNLERLKNHLDTLRWNPQLDKAAKVQAVEMAAEASCCVA